MIQKATVRVGDIIGNPDYPKAHFKLGVVIGQLPCVLLKEEDPEYGDFHVLTETGKQEWFTFDYVYVRCELLNREDRKD